VDVVASLPRTGARRRSLLAAIPLYWHLLSLDAPTVAVLWAWMLAREVGAAVPWSTLAVLGIGTWLIYVGDRLLDGLPGAPRTELRERHHFHARHRRSLLTAAAVAIGVLVWLVVARMPAAGRREDACIFAVAMIYAAAVHQPFFRIRFPRELVVGLVFACACAVPAWSAADYAHADLAVLVSLFAALCWLNCSAIHAWEQRGVSRTAPATLPGGPFLSLLASGIALASAIFVLLAQRNAGELRIAVVLFASSMLFFALDRDFRRSLQRRQSDAVPSALAMRVLADAILLTPILLLIPWPKLLHR
jgi:hypothetical protein